MKKIIPLTAFAFLLCAGWSDAGCAVVRKAAGVYHAPYVAPLAYAVPVAYGYVGYYNANYSAEQQLIKDQAAFIKLQTEAYQQLRQALTQPRSEQPAAGDAPQGYADYEAFARARCLKCHQDGTKAAEENGFIMFEKDGKIAPFSVPERRRQEDLIRRGLMPPGGGLGQNERQQAAQLLSKK